ncbi:MAG: leucyl aminopeptidase [Chloroflexota bacterium]
MDILVVQKSCTELECDGLIVNLFEGATSPGGATGAVDSALDGAISELISSGEFTGRLGQTATVRSGGRIHARVVVVVGLGKAEEFDLDRVRQVSAAAARAARSARCSRIASIVHGAGIGTLDVEAAAQATVEGAYLGLYRFTAHRQEKAEPQPREFVLVERDAKKIERVAAGAKRGRVTAEAAAWARDLTNEPGNYMTPALMAKAAAQMAQEFGLKVTILEEADMEREGMGALMGVARGSDEPAKLIVLEHSGGGQEKIAIVGKGLTFDSGGISLKPGENMHYMKDDMAGGAAVLAAMRIIAQLAPHATVYGIVPATENLPSGRALKPGDVVTAMNGKTIEIISTDAEGRLILADAVAYAVKLGADRIIDIATLTGACGVALGNQTAAIISNNDELTRQIKQASAQTGERTWELPAFHEYKEQLKSDVADLKNSGGRNAGTITGGLFIGAFAGDRPWAHLDIASMAWTDQETGYRVKGATGFGARLLAQLVMNLAAK